MTEYIYIVLSAVFVNNIVLTQFLGMCPFLGVTNKVSTTLGMGGAVLFVLTLETIVIYLVQRLILVPLHIEFMQIVAFILIVASLVQLVEIVIKKVAPPLYQALGIYLPLITTNCIVLAIPLLFLKKDYNLIQSVLFSVSHAVGFTMALLFLAGIREHLELADIPQGMKGIPVALLVASMLSLAFMGLAGIA